MSQQRARMSQRRASRRRRAGEGPRDALPRADGYARAASFTFSGAPVSSSVFSPLTMSTSPPDT